MSKITAESILEIRRKCKLNLVAFRHILLSNGNTEVDPADFHYDWSDSLLNGIDNEAIEAFRESAKTNYVTRAFPLYALTFPSKSRDYIVLVKKNDTLANNKLKEIEEEYLSNEIAKSNLIKIYQQSGDCFSVDVKNTDGEVINVRIEAYGKGASIRGLANKDRRPSISICDDLQDVDDANSQVMLENDWNWFLSNIIFLGQNTRIFLIGNNLGEKCIIERVLAMEGKLESIKFNTKRIPELTDKGESAWPAKRTVAEINLEKEDFRRLGKLDIWLREKMCQAVGEENRIFDPQDYRYFPHTTIDKILAECNRFGVLDPASSPELSSCYRAIVIVGVDCDNTWFIADVPFGRWDSATMIDEIFGAVQKYELKDFGIEKGIFKQVLEPFIYKEMAARNIFFNIIPIEHAKKGSKLERIKMLQPRFKAHKIWFPESAPWLAELLLEFAGVTKDAIKSLYSDLCFAKGTKIATMFGDKNIEDIKRGDFVLTPFGVNKVIACGYTGQSIVIEKFGVKATPKHKIFCDKIGFTSIDALCYNAQVSKLNTKEALLWRYKKLLYLMVTGITSIGRENIIAVTDISMANTVGMDFIMRCGNFIINGQYRKAGMFITSTVTLLIMTYLILNVYRLNNTIKYLKTSILYLLRRIWKRLGHLLLNGIGLRRVGCGIANTLNILLNIGRKNIEIAICVVRNMLTLFQPQDFVLQDVCNEMYIKQGDCLLRRNVSYVGKNLKQINMEIVKHAQEDALLNGGGCTQKNVTEDKQPVYNLSVEAVGVYYANGLLVSNCDAVAMIEQIAKAPGKKRNPNSMVGSRTPEPVKMARLI